MKRIENRDNEFLVQFRKSLRSSFPDALNIKVDYYLGEEQGTRGLYLTISSRFGMLYRKIMQLQGAQLPSDVEEEFMNVILDDLIMKGIAFFNMQAFDSVDPKKVEKEIYAKTFKHSSPRRLIYHN